MVSSNGVLQPESSTPIALPQYVKRALGYLRANMAEKVTLADLAAACGLSQRALLMQLERFLGVSPIAHPHRMRLVGSADRGDVSNGCRVSIASPFVAATAVTHYSSPSIAY